jgi:hypothetical protein
MERDFTFDVQQQVVLMPTHEVRVYIQWHKSRNSIIPVTSHHCNQTGARLSNSTYTDKISYNFSFAANHQRMCICQVFLFHHKQA